MRSNLLLLLVSTALLAPAAPVLAAPAITLAEAGFSAGPGTDYDMTKKLAAGSHVDVIWCGTHENWCLVDFHNKRGWLPMASLTFKVPQAVSMDDGGTPGGPAAAVFPSRSHSPQEFATRPGDTGSGGTHVFTTTALQQVGKLP